MKRKQKARQAQVRADEAKRLAAEAARQLQLEIERAAERAPILAAAEVKFVELVTQYNDCVNDGRVDLACGRINTAKVMATEAREWRNAARELVRKFGLDSKQFNCSREPVAELEKAIENKIAQRAAAEMEKIRQEAIAAETKRYEEQQKLRAESLRREAVTRLGRELDRRWTLRNDSRLRCALCVKGISDEAHEMGCFELVDIIDRLEAFLAVGEERYGLQLGLDCGHRNWADVIKPVFHTKKAHEIETLKGLNGLVEHEFESERREKACSKANLEAKAIQKNKRQAREKRLQAVYSAAGIDVGYDWSVIDDAMSDSYGDPYSIPDNWDDQPEFAFEEPGYFADLPDDFWCRPRNKYMYLLPDMPELPVDKNMRGGPMVSNILTWLDRQLGRFYHEVFAEAKELAGKHWWLVRDALLKQCTTSGREWRRFRVDSEGVLRHNLPPKKRYQRPVIIGEQVKTWLDGRKIIACGAHLFWYVSQETVAFAKETIVRGVWVSWKPSLFATSFSSFRQDRELNTAEMEFFIRLDNRTQADLLQHS